MGFYILAVLVMKTTVVKIVHMVVVADGGVSAAWSVLMFVCTVFFTAHIHILL